MINFNFFFGSIKQEGQKPCQIISAQLSVGNAIDLKASNGNTNIRINNREITKAELRMLQVGMILMIYLY